MTKKQKNVFVRIIITIALLLVINVLVKVGIVPDEVETEGINFNLIRFVVFIIPYLVIGNDILKKSFSGIKHGQLMDENFLMAVATVGAMVLGEYSEGVMVMLLYQIGELFQSYAVGKSRKNISDLMNIRPDYAVVEENGQLIKKDPDEIEIGTVIVVSPGEKVPIDGVIVEGSATLDTAALTGESIPREVTVGEEVVSGTIDTSGVIKIKTNREFGESTVSKILELVENSGMHKSKSEDFITKFARVYTPIVCAAALALAIGGPVVRLLMGNSANWGDWIYRALTFLVISCPCAFVISIPLSFFAGIGGASREGILVKGSNYLETLANTKLVVFDKTGTMTRGVFEVAGVHHSPLPEEKLLEYASHTESYSGHPIAKSLQSAYEKTGGVIDRTRVTNIRELPGRGVIAEVDGVEVAAGNTKLMDEIHVQYCNCSQVGTIVHVAVEGVYSGHILIKDMLKPTSKDAIKKLHDMGIEKTVMLTGDAKAVADSVAAELDIRTVYSQLLPEDKVTRVEELLAQKDEKDVLAFVGDGINDAPVLARADIGIAMGALGSDAAVEAADIVLMDDDPVKISKAIKISKKTMGIVYQNIVVALGIKVICLLLGALGIANMWLAIFADVGVMILAVLNAIRAMFTKRL